jgi:hypothetical protein
MLVETTPFNFSDAYRNLQPTATREIVIARETSHAELTKTIKYTNQVLDLCRLVYNMSIPALSTLPDWFEAEIRKSDPQFSLVHDRAEAGRIAALLLTERLGRSHTSDAIAVLATSFCGQRASVDDDEVTKRARDCLIRASKSLRKSAKSVDLNYPAQPDRSALITQMEQSFTAASLKPFLEALSTDYQAAGESLAKAASAAMRGLFDENQRLAEEIDLLWWHNGDWSESLDRPLAAVPSAGRSLVAGADLAAMIRIIPGPYGTNGVLRHSLGNDVDQPLSLQVAIEALELVDVKRAFSDHADLDILPIHTAAKLYRDLGPGAWGQSFTKLCGLNHEDVLTPYKLALQSFWECSLIKHGWAK